MRIACLQFAPQVGYVDDNLNRADAVLNRANPQNLDLLVLPELAFSGYNFKSLQHISPFLEHTEFGITSLWARTTALKYKCVVTVGYPEKPNITDKWLGYYNSAIIVNADGEAITNYRNTFICYSDDETWALPGGFFDGVIPGLGIVAIGTYKLQTKDFKSTDPIPFEFAYHIHHKKANLAIVSMAWMIPQDLSSGEPTEPDINTLTNWVMRLEPLIRAEGEGEIIVVLANRCGTEPGAVYAGTSCVLGIEDGEVKVYGILGHGDEELLVIDTTQPPQYKLVAEANTTMPEDAAQSHHEESNGSDVVSAERHTRSPSTSISSTVQSPVPSLSPSPPPIGTPRDGLVGIAARTVHCIRDSEESYDSTDS